MRLFTLLFLVQNVVVENRPVPELQSDDDALLKIDVAALCGSDLHVRCSFPIGESE
jgi:threonine dehydrogenase-like Zn-dependent dehydrogenase